MINHQHRIMEASSLIDNHLLGIPANLINKYEALQV